MRILLANSTCKVGGVSTFMLSLRSALLALGHECSLFFFERGTMEPYLPPGSSHFGTLADCMRLVTRNRIGVVHANNIDWTTGISAVRGLGAKLIVTAHKVREHDRTYGWTTANCDAFTTVSLGNAQELQRFTDLTILAVLNGIDTRTFNDDGTGDASDGAPPIVAWVGRGGSPIKNLEAFAAIIPTLRQQGLRVWVIDQHDRALFTARVPAAARTVEQLADRWDSVAFDQMPALYRAIGASGGCVVSTSTAEGLPLALLEAQACGCPVVGPAVRGVNEAVVTEQGGTLYPPTLSADALASLVMASVADRDAMRARRRAAAEHVRTRFSVDRMAAQYVRVYEQSPFGAADPMASMRARLRLSPVVHWRRYLDQRWGVGQAQYEALREFARQGEWRLAVRAGQASFNTSPTIFAKPRRLAALVNAHLRDASAQIG